MVGLSIALLLLGIIALVFLVAGLVRPRWGMPWSQQATRLKSTGLWIAVFVATSILMAVLAPRDGTEAAVTAQTPEPEAVAESEAAVATDKGTGEAPADATSEYIPPAEPVAVEPDASGEDVDAALECQNKLKIANEAGILLDLQMKPGKMVMVVDGPTWSRTPFDAKVGFVKTAVCMITAGDSSKSARVEVREHVNNHVVGEYNGSTLTVP